MWKNYAPASSTAPVWMVATWCAALSLSAVLAVPLLWLFNADPPLRQQLIFVALGCALASAMLLSICRLRAAIEQPIRGEEAASYISAEQSAPPAIPLRLPSRRHQQQRAFFWGVGMCTAIVGMAALATGTPQRSESVQRLLSAGADFAVLPAGEVSDLRRISSRASSSYTARVVVLLPDRSGGRSHRVIVRTKTNDPIRPGGPVSVLYAPTQPSLGAVAGDQRSLGSELRGETMPTYMRWSFIAAWLFGCAVVVEGVSRRHGFRSFSRMGGGDRAIRGQFSRIGRYHHAGTGGEGEAAKGQYLEVRTESGWIHFYVETANLTQLDALGRDLWVCWDARRGARAGRLSPRRTPGALVFDTGWVVHGTLNAGKMQTFRESGVAADEMAPPAFADRSLHLWDPRAKWLLQLQPMAFGLFVLVIGCAAFLTFDVGDGWRWAAGAVGILGLVGASGNPADGQSQPA